MNPSQQTATIGAEQSPPRLSCVQIEENLFNKLSHLCAKEGISMNILASELIRHMLIFEPKTVKQIVEMIKCRPAR